MDQTAQRDLKILTEVAERANVTQRGLAKNLDAALGLTNLSRDDGQPCMRAKGWGRALGSALPRRAPDAEHC